MKQEGRFYLPDPPAHLENIATWVDRELVPCLRALRPHNGETWAVDKVGPDGWRGNAQLAAGGSATDYVPWTPFFSNAAETAFQIAVRTGTLRGAGGSVIPANANALLTLQPSSDNYVSLSCTLVLGQLVSCEYVVTQEEPAAEEPEENAFPTTYNVILFKLPCGENGPTWGSLEQYENTSLSLVTIHTDTTGSAPEWVKHYSCVITR